MPVRSDPLQQKLAGGENFGSAVLKHGIATGRPFEERGERLRAQHATNVGAIGGRIRRLEAGASLATQRAGSTRFAGPRGFSRQLDQAAKRGKARTGIEARGEKAVLNQQLKDRLQIARQGVNRRGQLLQSAGNAAHLRAGGDAQMRNIADQERAAMTGAVGAVAGGALRGFGDNLFDTGDLSSGMVAQQQEVDDFFGAGIGDVGGLSGGFDFNTSTRAG